MRRGGEEEYYCYGLTDIKVCQFSKFVSLFCTLCALTMTIITEEIVVALLISLILASLRKIYDWIFSSRSNIPSPPAYPILRHLPYFWNSDNEEKMLRLWGEDFKAEGIFEFDILLGKVLEVFW